MTVAFVVAPRFRDYYLPLLLWGAVLVVFAFVALPEAPQPAALNVDKMRHAAAYALLGALAARAAGAAARGGAFAFVAAFFAVFTFGLGTETIQIFVPGRCADVVDFGADLFGGGTGALLYLWAFGAAPSAPRRL